MIKKILFSTATLTTLLFTISTTYANLSITNNSNLSNISVQCTGPMPGVPISKGSSVNMDWSMVQLILGGLTGTCRFFNNGSEQVEASIAINPNLSSAMITNYIKKNANLNITFNPIRDNAYHPNLSAVVTGG